MIQSNLGKKNMEVPSSLDQIRKVSEELLKNLEPFSIDETTVFNIKLCVEEAVRNAIVHGNRLKKDLTVEIAYWIEGSKLYVEIKDKGKGFKLQNIPDPTKEENLLKEHGRGVFLINNLMDEVRYNERGNEIKMVKFLSGGKNGS